MFSLPNLMTHFGAFQCEILHLFLFCFDFRKKIYYRKFYKYLPTFSFRHSPDPCVRAASDLVTGRRGAPSGAPGFPGASAGGLPTALPALAVRTASAMHTEKRRETQKAFERPGGSTPAPPHRSDPPIPRRQPMGSSRSLISANPPFMKFRSNVLPFFSLPDLPGSLSCRRLRSLPVVSVGNISDSVVYLFMLWVWCLFMSRSFLFQCS